ncbi:UNVERIFIED_CONTAM: hypothetical protein Sradi_0667200 [Sesamum radiatum]|uniref:Uncharacterized protein n=1 Tax=Sesamum radiatum TaxID=300843 RepID=A0AAW2VQR0_SESRA
MLLLETQIPMLRIAIQERRTAEDNARMRLEEFEALDEKDLKLNNKSNVIKPA